LDAVRRIAYSSRWSKRAKEPIVSHGESLRILLVEDTEPDAVLIARELRKADIACKSLRVQGETDLVQALETFAPDVVLSDHSLPHFNAHDTLRVVQRVRPGTPVIIVTGSLDEETAAQYIQEGAADYVVKHRLHRLGPAVRRAIVNAREVRERKRAQEFLSQAQALAHIGSWEWDVACDTITWSEETYRIFGLTPAHGPIVLEQYLALIHPDDRETVAGAVRHTLETGASFEIDHRIVHPDGSVHFLHGRGGLVTDATGRPLGMTGTVLDITARKRAEEALREAKNHLETLIASAPLPILSVDADGIVETWNPAAERVFGWTAAEVAGRPVPVVPEDKKDECAALRRRVMGGESLNGVELTRQKKDGTPVTVSLFAAPLRDANARVTGILALIEDVTGVKRLEQQVFQAQKMEAVGRLAGGVAHDFNNLLTAILGSTDLLLESLPSDHPGREEAQETRKAALRAADLTRQLLAFSRQQVLAPRVLDLNDVVADMERLLLRLIGEDVELRTVLADDLGAVRADPGQLEQVIVNLAVNARDAMPDGGKLTIETLNVELEEAYLAARTVVVPGSYVMLAVSDNGTGMNAATQAHVFEPFFTTKPKGQGTGLGLATVYGIVKQSGGYIWLYSEPGRGTTFKVYLPRVDAPVESARPEPVIAGSLRGSETILLVEDQEEVRNLVRRLLEARGYQVLVAACGHDALRLAEQQVGVLDLLVTDVVMPGMSGREVALLLGPAHPTMRVLYLSGYTDESIVRHGMLEPGIAFLQKPFTAEALARKVREVFDAS
jgi:two-component system cell cycle sensor histidine kinase/response regulator CckA